ncbi:putative galactose mutarotase-like domain-containing protein [Rosa chinensis]|uniref:Putative galactose mutarotase-like domain-containing protein n=1 Tax=Rosa chinensis TaxID=74649 RepID=A0A2P6PB30_ROSCH|nr:putative galactose mutarotase-like domain-containing protein [Rosa chinensis]
MVCSDLIVLQMIEKQHILVSLLRMARIGRHRFRVRTCRPISQILNVFLGSRLLNLSFLLVPLYIGTSLYGTGEVSGQLERTGKRVSYGSGTTSLYQSHPWVLAVLPSGEALGVLADTTKRCEVLYLCPQSGPWVINN